MFNEERYSETCSDWHIRYADCFAKIDVNAISLSDLPPKFDRKAIAPVALIQDSFYPDEDDEEESEDAPCARAIVNLFFRKDKDQPRSAGTAEISIDSINVNPLPYGLVNLNRSFIHIFPRRVPAGGVAKYRVLPHSEIVRAMDPFQLEREYINAAPINDWKSFHVMRAWAEAEENYPSAVEALERLTSLKSLGVAFSPEYGFGISYTGNSIFLYRYTHRIARVSSAGEVLLKPPAHRLYEELSEYGLTVRKIES